MRYRTSPRLKDFGYAGHYAYFLTLVTRRRFRAFGSADFVAHAEECLRRSAAKYGYRVWAYCFMPDHLHLLVSGGSVPVTEFVRHFKQLAGFAHRKSGFGPLWQVSYHDRVLRCDEDLTDVACYIWANPVRAGLCTEIGDYPFSGPAESIAASWGQVSGPAATAHQRTSWP